MGYIVVNPCDSNRVSCGVQQHYNINYDQLLGLSYRSTHSGTSALRSLFLEPQVREIRWWNCDPFCSQTQRHDATSFASRDWSRRGAGLLYWTDISVLRPECCWWLVSHLSGCFWLFAPKFWEVIHTYEWWFCSKMNAAWMVGTVIGGGDTQHLLTVFLLAGGNNPQVKPLY